MHDSLLPRDADLPEPPPFDPVATACSRHDGWHPARQRAFVAALTVMGAVAPAARSVGMSARSAYKLRARPDAASFAAAWDAAQAIGRERAYEIAVDRAINGVVVPRFYRGKQVGARRTFDHRLLIAALAARPRTAQQSCEIERNAANFANFEALLDALADPVDPGAPYP